MAEWLWPAPGNTKITSGVGPRWGTTHKGIDISAPKGASIIASMGGEVIKAYTTCTHNYSKTGSCGCSTYGNHVYIDHKNGYISRYAHMTSVNVRVGEKVHQGKVIGTVGSTGHSTGNHLHFEIRSSKNDSQYYNPENFVTPANTIQGPTTPTEDTAPAGDIVSTEGDAATGGYVPYTPDSVSAVRSGQSNDRPMYAYLDIMIGGKKLSYQHGKPSIIQSFNIDRLKEAGCQASFTIFDDNWDEIEMYLSEHWDDISIKYGYVNGLTSPEYKMMLQDYTIDFSNTGTILSIRAISTGVYENLQQIDLDTGTRNPTIAIKEICRNMNWRVLNENFVSTNTVTDRPDVYRLNKDNPATYIINVILPEAQTEENETVSFYLEDDGYNTAHLVRLRYGENNDYSQTIRTYVYQKGYDSAVKSINFHTGGIFGGTSNLKIVTGAIATAIGADKQEYSVEENQDTVTTSATGNYSNTRAKQSVAVANASADSPTQAKNRLSYYIKNSTNSQYEAEMRIIGDPTINLFDDVRIINVTDSGYLHHTSGIYFIKGIIDSISNGEFETTLKLQRNGDINQGIELRNPRSVSK